jgi:hypothetical protein
MRIDSSLANWSLFPQAMMRTMSLVAYRHMQFDLAGPVFIAELALPDWSVCAVP